MNPSLLPQACMVAAALSVAIPCCGDEQEKSRWTPYAVGAKTFDDAEVRLALVEARTQVSARMSIGVALAFVDANDGFQESQLRLHATGTVTLHGWTLENRNLLSLGTETAQRLRLRLRAVSSGMFAASRLSLRAFDELYVDLDRHWRVRNNLAAGVGLALGRRGVLELYHVWSRQQGGGYSNYPLAIFTLNAGT